MGLGGWDLTFCCFSVADRSLSSGSTQVQMRNSPNSAATMTCQHLPLAIFFLLETSGVFIYVCFVYSRNHGYSLEESYIYIPNWIKFYDEEFWKNWKSFQFNYNGHSHFSLWFVPLLIHEYHLISSQKSCVKSPLWLAQICHFEHLCPTLYITGHRGHV